ncbi:hypothetical protein MN608_01972 [Microdochium nivale]|nr:hypothetical protein MN608_01972 [Microdochium nivale]
MSTRYSAVCASDFGETLLSVISPESHMQWEATIRSGTTMTVRTACPTRLEGIPGSSECRSGTLGTHHLVWKQLTLGARQCASMDSEKPMEAFETSWRDLVKHEL